MELMAETVGKEELLLVGMLKTRMEIQEVAEDQHQTWEDLRHRPFMEQGTRIVVSDTPLQEALEMALPEAMHIS